MLTFFDAISHFCQFLGLYGPEKSEHAVATQMAINALTSCMKRQRGCKYCSGSGERISVIDRSVWKHTGYSIKFEDNCGYLISPTGDSLPIDFCPICGRDFKGPVEPGD